MTNGDSTAITLRQTALVDARRRVARRAARGAGARRRRRGAARRAGGFLGAPRRRARGARRARSAAGREGEYVLWFEADLYDQLQIAQILARLAALRVPAERITLICIGEYLGIAHFGGLGELRPDQLEALPAAAAVTLTDDALDLATRAWAALRAPDPRGLAAIVAARSPELRFLPEAFDRLGREYPWTRDGLSLTERRLLAAVADGAGTAGEAFVRAAAPRGAPVPRRHVGLRGDRAPGAVRGAAAGGGRRRGRSPHAGRADRRPAAACSTATRTTSRSTGSTAGSAACTWWAARCRGAGTRGSRRSWPPPALEALRGVQLPHRGRGSERRSARLRLRDGAGAPNCLGLLPETGHNPRQFAPRTTAGARARAHSLPSVMLLARAAPQAPAETTNQSSSSTQSIARVTALRHLR